MSRILILVLFMLWLVWDPTQPVPHAPIWPSLPLFFGVYLLLVLGTGIWGRMLSRRVAHGRFQRDLGRFNWVMEGARVAVPVWFAIGLFFLGWRGIVADLFGPKLLLTCVGMVVGTFPPFAAWIGLWWSQFPTERAMREQSLLTLLDADLPLHPPPGLVAYLSSNLRQQIMLMGVPVLTIVLGHDLTMLLANLLNLRGSALDSVEVTSWIVSTLAVFLFAPEILRRVLNTEPLPDTPLRRRLDALSRRTGIGYRDILLWKTDHNLGNAAVIGFLPRMRYILLSDLLLERMPDEEIEAVFAHEIGHIVHRHMIWYVVFVAVLGFINAGPGQWLSDHLAARLGENARGLVLAVFLITKFLILFGFISRTFERQADVYAARTMQVREARVIVSPVVSEAAMDSPPADPFGGDSSPPEVPGGGARAADASDSHVGAYGARLFGSALRRVAVVNNIPLAARSWCHGSIATRMQYLQLLSQDPIRTTEFDRFMRWVYVGIIGALVVSSAVFAMSALG